MPDRALPQRIWLLEDSPLEAARVAEALDGTAEVSIFSDGLTLLERLSGTALPDALLLDWFVPGMSGIDVCRFVRESRDELTLPILMVTGNTDGADLAEALAAGASDFIVKPFRPPELVARVRRALATKRLSDDARHLERTRLEAIRSEARAAQLDLEDKLGVAGDENKQKDKYIGILGHDLRNPLNAIRLTARMMRRSDDRSCAGYAERVERSAERMALLVRDILDFARGRLLERIPIVRAHADIGLICNDVVEELRIANPDRQIEVRATGDLRGFWDLGRLSQVISNLVGNGIEHSSSVISVVSDGNAQSIVQISVHNDGAAIPEAELPFLFEAFRKQDKSSAGLGLGLYIVKQVLLAHGGTVHVSSSADGGTTFVIALPRASATDGRELTSVS